MTRVTVTSGSRYPAPAPRPHLSYDECLARLEELGCRPFPSGGGHNLLCPLHGDTRASAHMAPGTRGQSVVIYCHACGDGSSQALLDTLNGRAAGWVANPQLVAQTKSRSRRHFEQETTYDYPPDLRKQRGVWVDTDTGELIPGKAFLWQHRAAGGWESCRNCNHDRPLYGAHCVPLAEGGGIVLYVVEGEKDCDAMHEDMLLAVSGSDGAGRGKWRRLWTDALRRVPEVRVVADADPTGVAYGWEVADALTREGRKVEVFTAVPI